MHISDRSIAIISLIVGTVLGLAGIAAAYYFYVKSVQERIPTFLVNPVRAVIVDSKSPQLSDLSISYKGSAVGPRSVTAVRLYFWNAGAMPIQGSDILQPIECVFPQGTDILDAKILNRSRDVTGFKITSPSGTPNILDITFDILEKDDGGSIQVIYAGDYDATITFKGTVVGSKSMQVQNAYATENDVPFIEQMKLHWKEFFGMIFGMILVSIFVIFVQRPIGILFGIISKLPGGEEGHQLIFCVIMFLLGGWVTSLILVSLNENYQALADVPSILIGKN